MEQFARPARCWPMTRATERSTPEPRTLLLVHGDILVRTALAAYLRECGYDVVEAGTTEEAIQAPRRGRSRRALRAGADAAQALRPPDVGTAHPPIARAVIRKCGCALEVRTRYPGRFAVIKPGHDWTRAV